MKLHQQTYMRRGKRHEVVNMQAWNRVIRIAAIDPDSFIAQETRLTITKMLRTKNIHISPIQETHIPYNQNYKLNGYRIITSKAETQGANGMPTGGVAILIREAIEAHIGNVPRLNRRIAKITLNSENAHTYNNNQYICTTSRKTRIEQNEHCEQVQEAIATPPKTSYNTVCRCKWENQENKKRETSTDLWAISKSRKRKGGATKRNILPRKHDTHGYMDTLTANKSRKIRN